MTWTFDKPAEVWKIKSEYFNLKVRIDEEKFSFFSKNWDFGQFFPAEWENSVPALMPTIQGKITLFLRSKAEKIEENYNLSRRRGFSSRFSWTKKRCFDNSVSIFLLKSDFFAQSPNFLVKLISFSKKLFPSKCSSGHGECSFDTPVVMISAEVKNFFCWKFNRMSKLYPSQQNYLPSECLLDTRFAFLATRPKKFC